MRHPHPPRAILATSFVLAVPVLAQATPVAAEVASFTFWKDVIPLFSVPLAVAAFFHSRRSDIAKADREKREELKGSIEKLIEFRTLLEERAASSSNEQQFESFSSRLNTRKLIYLQSAEELARSLDHVTPAEWVVLGYEHMQDSNFRHAEEMYAKAVEAARSSAAAMITRVTAQRSLASAQIVQIVQGEAGLARGRQTYAESAAMLSGVTDPYSRYTTALTYRYWANVEWGLDHRTEAADRLGDAIAVLATMPDVVPLRRSEARQCARMLADLADQFRFARNLEAARLALRTADTALGDWPENPTYEVKGRLALGYAWLAKAEDDNAGVQLQAAAARGWFQMLEAANPARPWGLNAAGSLLAVPPDQPAPKPGFPEPRPQASETTTLPT